MTPESVSARDALVLVRDWSSPTQASIAQHAASLLETLDPSQELNLAPMGVVALAHIYRRRVAMRTHVAGTEEFLSRLETYVGTEVLSSSTKIERWLLGLWFDLELTDLIGCVIGEDRRSGV